MRVELGGHELDFFDYSEICQGEPEACSLVIDGWLIERRKFDPSPLLFDDKILVPMRKIGFFKSGYVLTLIDPSASKIVTISKIHAYMRLISVQDRDVTFATTVWGYDTATHAIK